MQSFSFLLLIECLILLYSSNLAISALLGEPCVDTTNSLNGNCTFIGNCAHVLNAKSRREYKRCGFLGHKEIVCCAQKKLESLELPEVPYRRYARECEEYKSSILKTETTLNCEEGLHALVVGGEDADPMEFPHMALLGCKGNASYIWVCGGTLISPNYILTAAHCAKPNFQCENLTVARLGELDINSENDTAQPINLDIKKIIPHPEYEYNGDFKYNDIALIKLETEVAKFNLFIRPACLPYQDYNDEKYKFIVTGWGSTELAGPKASHLQKATVDFFSHTLCNLTVEEGDEKLPSGIKRRTQICAGSNTTNRDACQGDSGGPLQIIHPNHPCMYSVVGITSYGQACGVPGVPGVYTRVYHYIKWIESIVWD